MIVVKLMDGLGNQMFQYAFGRYLQIQYNEKIVFETTKFDAKSVRKLGIQNLCLNGEEGKSFRFATGMENKMLCLISKCVRVVAKVLFKNTMHGDLSYSRMICLGFYTTEDSIVYHSFKRTKMPIKFVRGYFQSEKYFSLISNTIKEECRVKKPASDVQDKLIRNMHSCESVSVHIRRGDYLSSRKFFICSEKYYIRAVECFNELLYRPIYYIFSNSKSDLNWIKKNYNLPAKNIIYVDIGEDEFDDLRFMYNCKHHIIANSTFSWWGSYLGYYKEGKTIVPSRWYNDSEPFEDIYCPDWIKIEP